MNINEKLQYEFYKIEMTDSEFIKFSSFITKNFGIKLPEAKKVMLQSRLQKRLRQLKITSFEKYFEYLFSKGNEQEIINMIDVVSTNKTDFFRESQHFTFLNDEILPEIIHKKDHIKIWSAGCSSGEEPYTIAIVLSEFQQNHKNIDYSIFSSDISLDILQKATNAIYKEEKVGDMPIELKKKYLLKSKDRTKPTVRVIPELRKKVKFDRINLMDDKYNVETMFDIIFCRNVLIYFDRTNQENIINKLCKNLMTGGYFFIGHSESLLRMDLPLRQIKPTIFQKI
ncbi:CheR family methyltransferase [Bacteroidota bacterium]